jgi:hypothetical protein
MYRIGPETFVTEGLEAEHVAYRSRIAVLPGKSHALIRRTIGSG